MHVESRVVFARQAYQRALVAARVAPTPRRWRKLVTAARNLRVAHGERERRRIAALAPAARALAVVPRQPSRRGRVLIPFPTPRAGKRWPELVREWERARALMEEATRLVAEARELCGRETARGKAPRPGARRERVDSSGA